MGASCFSLFEDFGKDPDDDLLLTEEEKKEIRRGQRRKVSLMREGPKGFEVKFKSICNEQTNKPYTPHPNTKHKYTESTKKQQKSTE